MLHAEFFQKTLHFSRNLDFYMFWAGFVWGLYGGGLTGKCWSLVHDLNFWPARHTPRQFSQKAQGTDQLLFAFWTAGFTARPPDIGSVWCTIIFQVSNRTIVCILKQSASLYGDCMVTVWSQFVWWLYGARQRYEPNYLCANPPTVLRVFLDASRHSAFTHVVFVSKTQILTKL